MLKVLAFVLLVSVARADDASQIRSYLEFHYKMAGGAIVAADNPKFDMVTTIAKSARSSSDQVLKDKTSTFLKIIESASVAEDKSGNKNSIFTADNIRDSYEKYVKKEGNLSELQGVLKEYSLLVQKGKAADEDTLSKAVDEYNKNAKKTVSLSDLNLIEVSPSLAQAAISK